jgi:predicted GIY-YIG superfamily endonuclease
MRPLFKNDILRLSKNITEIKCWSVYFLIHNDEIIYVGCSEMPFSRMSVHIRNFNFEKYHVLNFKDKQDAIDTEKYYIKSFKPIYNYVHNEDHISRHEKIIKNKEFLEKKKNNDTLYITEDKVNILNNSYIRKNGKYYFKIKNIILIAKYEAKIYVYDAVNYAQPTNLFGNIDELIT